MKIGVVLVFTFLLSLAFVSADLSVPCSGDTQCRVALGGGYSCVQRTCSQQTVASAPAYSGSFIPHTRTLQWNLVSVEEQNQAGTCTRSGCLSFAPAKAENSWQKFVDFVLYVKI